MRQSNQSSAEVDLVIQRASLIIPIEIKSGPAGKLRSLHRFIDRSQHALAIRIYGGEYSLERHTTPAGKPYRLLNLPYYLGTRLNEYAVALINDKLG